MKKTRNNKNKDVGLIRHRTAEFFENYGRRPRILLTRVEPKGSDREVKLKATALADMGFDVDINTTVQSADNIARMALENDVHAIGIPGISDDCCELISQFTGLFVSKHVVLAIWTRPPSENLCNFAKSAPDRMVIFTVDTDATEYANAILDILEKQF